MTTPLRQQYLQIRKQFPDAIVFFRFDFYKSFDGNAKVAEACNIVLAGRDMGLATECPSRRSLSGFRPYLAKLVQAGHKVAIFEQTGNQQQVVGVPGRVLETRGVVSVVSHHSIQSGLLHSSTQTPQGHTWRNQAFFLHFPFLLSFHQRERRVSLCHVAYCVVEPPFNGFGVTCSLSSSAKGQG